MLNVGLLILSVIGLSHTAVGCPKEVPLNWNVPVLSFTQQFSEISVPEGWENLWCPIACSTSSCWVKAWWAKVFPTCKQRWLLFMRKYLGTQLIFVAKPKNQPSIVSVKSFKKPKMLVLFRVLTPIPLYLGNLIIGRKPNLEHSYKCIRFPLDQSKDSLVYYPNSGQTDTLGKFTSVTCFPTKLIGIQRHAVHQAFTQQLLVLHVMVHQRFCSISPSCLEASWMTLSPPGW